VPTVPLFEEELIQREPKDKLVCLNDEAIAVGVAKATGFEHPFGTLGIFDPE